MTKCLVTGGAGFIGSNLVNALLEEGCEVSVVDNLSSGKKEYLNPKAGFYNLDIRSQELESVFLKEGFDYVFHLAAQIDVRASVKDPGLDWDINIFGGLNVLELSRKYQVKKFLFASTGGAVYGDTSDIPTTEEVLPRPMSPYGIHKLTFEKYLDYYHQVHGLDYIVLRPANIYGPGQYKGGETGVISIFIDKAVQKEQCVINGDGKQTRDFVYVDDLVRAFLLSKQSDFLGVLNIGSAQETSVLEVALAIEKENQEKLDLEHGPEQPGEQKRSCLSYKKAADVLDFKPQISLDMGIKRTLDWTRDKYSKKET